MTHRSPRDGRSASPVYVAWITVVALLLLLGSPYAAVAQPVEVGFEGPSYPAGVGRNSEVTSEKPESKLWWNDGAWWASIWHTASASYHIYRLDLTTQTWEDQGTALDSRIESKADILWDGNKLYVASHL